MSPNTEAIAAEILRTHGVTEPPVSVEQIAEELGLIVAYHDLEDDVSGMLIRHGEGPAVVAVNVRHHENRQRFSISHELGHFLMHQDQPSVFVDDLLVHFRAETGNKTYDPREAEANAFAASLLMPRDFLTEDLQRKPIDVSDDTAVRSLARRYGVSVQALTIRLANLGFVGPL